MQVHLTRISKNAKTGPIPVSTSEEKTCPTTCPFFGQGCYASAGPLALHWRKVSGGERGMPWDEFCAEIAKLPKRQLWRHNQAGDLPHEHEYIDEVDTMKLVKANKGKSGFTYTHHDIGKPHNRIIVEMCNDRGFTVNVSGNNPTHAVQLKRATTAPVVSVVAAEFWGDRRSVKHDGETFVRCPAEYDKNVSCATCGACAVADRKAIIGFTAHGTQKKKASIIARG